MKHMSLGRRVMLEIASNLEQHDNVWRLLSFYLSNQTQTASEEVAP